LRYVIDASALVKTVLPEPGKDVAAELIRKHRDGSINLVAPDHILIEAANAIWKHVSLIKDVSENEGSRALALLRHSGVFFYPATDYFTAAFHFAVAHRHPIYDCIYLVLAEDLNCGIISADQKMIQKFGSPPVYSLEQFRI
jgi:predicted nucleic acid-binding protein